jgi:hypothetical protein
VVNGTMTTGRFAEEHARSVLEAEGFEVRYLSAAPHGPRMADFLVSDAESTYLIEVTGREESNFLRELLDEAREVGIADGERKVHYDNTLDGIIRDKVRQLAETPVKADFRVVWLAALHRDWRYLAQLLRRTLYGSARVVAFGSVREKPQPRECLYYHRFSFHRHPDLDAVVLCAPEADACTSTS